MSREWQTERGLWWWCPETELCASKIQVFEECTCSWRVDIPGRDVLSCGCSSWQLHICSGQAFSSKSETVPQAGQCHLTRLTGLEFRPLGLNQQVCGPHKHLKRLVLANKPGMHCMMVVSFHSRLCTGLHATKTMSGDVKDPHRPGYLLSFHGKSFAIAFGTVF